MQCKTLLLPFSTKYYGRMLKGWSINLSWLFFNSRSHYFSWQSYLSSSFRSSFFAFREIPLPLQHTGTYLEGSSSRSQNFLLQKLVTFLKPPSVTHCYEKVLLYFFYLLLSFSPIQFSLEVLPGLISYLICSVFLISSQRAEILLVSETCQYQFCI